MFGACTRASPPRWATIPGTATPTPIKRLPSAANSAWSFSIARRISLDHDLGIVVLRVQVNLRHTCHPHPQVEPLDADAGLPHLHADHPSEIGVDLQKHPGAPAVRLFEADL